MGGGGCLPPTQRGLLRNTVYENVYIVTPYRYGYNGSLTSALYQGHLIIKCPWFMGVRSLRDRGGRNFIQGDLTSRESIQRAGGGGGGGGGWATVRFRPFQ